MATKKALLRLFLVVAVGVPGSLLAGGCATDRQVIAQAQDVHQSLEPAVIEDPALADYIQQVGDRIVRVARELDQQGVGPKAHKTDEDTSWMYQNMQFHLVNSDTLNAFTTGGKHMYIYSKLFETCKNEDELAAVMAHEYAHVYCRHVAKGMNRQLGLLGLSAAAGGAGYLAGGSDSGAEYAGIAASAALAAGQFIGMKFTRDDENEADKYGFVFCTHAGWDPNRFAGFFKTLIKQGLDKTPAMLSDHPKLADRVAATERRAADLPPEAREWRRRPVADDRRFRELQDRAAEVGKRMPNDKSLQQAKLMLAAFPSCVTPTEQPEQIQAQQILLRAMKSGK